MQKTLYILRHAKAETASAGQDDHERRLTQRGVEEACRMGEYLVSQGIAPDKILCSTSVRTQETLQYLFPSPLVGRGLIEYTDKLYLASANEMIALLAAIPESINSLMLIAHNPGLHQLCLRLAAAGEQALLDRLAAKFSTCALAAIAFDGVAWRNMSRAHGTLTMFIKA